MKVFRIQIKRFFFILIFIAIAFYALHLIWNNDENVPECIVSPDTHKKLIYLLNHVQEALKAVNLTYFACYNTLWGVLKLEGFLPWQNTLQLCVFNNEISAIDEGFLANTFKHYGLIIGYNSAGGVYKIFTVTEDFPFATLTVFEEDSLIHQMRRVGWIHRMLPPNSCEQLNCFPPELVAYPLPTVQFYGYELPVPREGIEIQKYLFPNSWWKEITPSQCRNLHN